MELEKGDENNLLGKLWIYSAGRRQAYYYTDKPETVVSELSLHLGLDTALAVMDDLGQQIEGLYDGFSVSSVKLPIKKDSIEFILTSECDVINLDDSRCPLPLDKQAVGQCNEYFELYDTQKKAKLSSKVKKEESPGKEYDTTYFMKSFFIPFRTALEIGDNKQWIDFTRKNILNYSEGKKFRKDIEGMINISGCRNIEKDDMLTGLGLYASMINYYMTEKFEGAAETRDKIEDWRKKNRLDV
jgi:hypothetical protein